MALVANDQELVSLSSLAEMTGLPASILQRELNLTADSLLTTEELRHVVSNLLETVLGSH